MPTAPLMMSHMLESWSEWSCGSVGMDVGVGVRAGVGVGCGGIGVGVGVGVGDGIGAAIQNGIK